MRIPPVFILSALLAGLVAAHAAAGRAAAVDRAVLESETQRVKVIDRAAQSVLVVLASTGRGGGSGVVISPDGLALTNYHVTRPSGHWMKCGMVDGKLYDAVLVGLDPTGDVALIKLFGRDDFPCAVLGDSDEVRQGDSAFALGNPFLLATDFRPTATWGIISGTHRYQYPSGTLLEYADCLQTDAAINPGNSGGPLFDAQGRLIGINGRCSFEKRGRVSVGVGYAISINQIENFLGCLRSGRIVDHATLGFHVTFDDDGRVVIDDIVESSDAYRRGLRYGDEIVALAGRPIDSPNALTNAAGIFPKGWRLPLSYRREGERRDVLVRLAGVHHAAELWDQMEGRRKIEIPQPKPDGPRDPHDPSPPEPRKRPPHGHPRALSAMHAKPPAPDVIKAHYEKRRGYANYFYNRRGQERLWEGWTASLGEVGGAWSLSGAVAGGKPFAVEVDDRTVHIDLPAGRTEWVAGDDLAGDLAPPHSGGLLPALYLWRRLATAGLDRFGQVYYWGTAPLDRDGHMADVLVGTYGGVACRFYFDPAESRLLALEMFPGDETDPCEIYFRDYRVLDGRHVPGTLEVRFGDETYGCFSVETFTVAPASGS